jgi:MoaA/NifB/PqqE/SkfB family radical SAM enzyme
MSGHRQNETFPIHGELNQKNPNRMIARSKVLEILEDMVALGVRAVTFGGGGEPTVHPDHCELFASARLRGLQVALVTNGERLRGRTQDVVSENMQWIRVSVDAATKETYARIRAVKADRFDAVLRNVSDIVSRRLRPSVGLSFIVTRDNYKEISAFATLARDIGVDNVRFAPIHNDEPDYYGPLKAEISDSLAQARQVTAVRVYDQFASILAELHRTGSERRTCYYQHFSGQICADLGVYTCCLTAHSRHGFIGSISDSRLVDFWHSASKKDRVSAFDARKCGYCRYHSQNDYIHGAVTKQLDDVFV